MIIATDFDGTLCVHRYPNIGYRNLPLIEWLIQQRKDGHQLILWTCRNGSLLTEAVSWCKEFGLEFDAINEDVPSIKHSDFGREKSIKVYADVYIDDRSINFPSEVSK